MEVSQEVYFSLQSFELANFKIEERCKNLLWKLDIAHTLTLDYPARFSKKKRFLLRDLTLSIFMLVNIKV